MGALTKWVGAFLFEAGVELATLSAALPISQCYAITGFCVRMLASQTEHEIFRN
jgi:hypothetical protein